MKKACILIAFCAFFNIAFAQKDYERDIVAMQSLVTRVVPEYAKNIVIERLTSDSVDCFELESKGDKLVIRGNNAMIIPG